VIIEERKAKTKKRERVNKSHTVREREYFFDEQGYIVPNAIVEAVNLSAVVLSRDTSDEAGYFSLRNLPSNHNEMKLEARHSDLKDFEILLSSLTNGQINPKFGLVANPDTRHFLGHDVFTYVSSVPAKKSEPRFINEKISQVRPGDTVFTNNGYVILKKVNSSAKGNEVDVKNLNLLLTAEIEIHTLDKTYEASPMFGVKDNSAIQYDAYVEEAKLRFNTNL